MSATVEDQIENGDKVVSRYTVRGTHEGDLMNMPPTGKTADVAGISIVRFENGKAQPVVVKTGIRQESRIA